MPTQDGEPSGLDPEVLHNSGGGLAINASGDVDITGYVDVSNVGCEVYLAVSQTVSSGSPTTVVFDTVVEDHFSGFDISTGEYTVRQAGDYDVTTLIEWLSAFSGGTTYRTAIQVNGNSVAKRIQEVAGPSSSESYVHPHVSKTLYGLSSGDTIRIQVYQETGSNQDISSEKANTYLTITKVG